MVSSFSVTTAHILSASTRSMRASAVAVLKQHEQCRITPATSTARDQCSRPSRKTMEPRSGVTKARNLISRDIGSVAINDCL